MAEWYLYLRSHRRVQKRIIAVLVVFVLITVLAIAHSNKRQQASGKSNLAILDNTAAQEQIKKLQQDSDSDGLRDWEETLYHTDPQKSDTDGDGTPDGEEVKLGRDPLKPNTAKNSQEPNDPMATSTLEMAQEGDGAPSQNLTRRMAQEVGKQIIIQQIAHPDIPFDPEVGAQNFVDTVVGAPSDDVASSLTDKDIIIGRDDTKAAVKTYEISLQNILTTNFRGLTTKSDVQIFSDAMVEQNFEKLKILDRYLAGYDGTILQLKNLSAPPQLAKLHLEYVNLTIAQANTVRKMRDAKDDPVGALVAIKQYITIQEHFKTLFDKFIVENQKIGA